MTPLAPIRPVHSDANPITDLLDVAGFSLKRAR